MVWKKIGVTDPGSSTVYGGEDMEKISDYFTAIDLGTTDVTDEPEIATKTRFNSEIFRIKAPSGFDYIFRGKNITADRIVDLPLLTGDAELATSSATTANDWGDNMQTFNHQFIRFANPANTFYYTLNTSAITANRNITLPLLTNDDEIVFKNATQTLTNKTLTAPTITSMTIETDSNTIKDSTTNNNGDLLVNNGTKFIRFARGNANQHLAMNSTGTAAIWTDPPSGSSGGESPIPSPGNTIWGVWSGSAETAASGIFDGNLTAIGTGSSYFSSADKVLGRQWSIDSSTTEDGLHTPINFTSRNMNPELRVLFQYDKKGDQTGPRLYIGLVSNPGLSYDDSDMLDSQSGIVLHQRSDSSSWKITHNDGDSSQNEDFLQTADDDIHEIRFVGYQTNSRWGYSLDGANLTYINSEIPAQNTSLGLIIAGTRNDSTTRDLRIFYIGFKHDVPTV
ncbi:MAG: hypothetical protein ACPKPY_05550 [Nitrososphaeraceae archaeon]